jgi:hypothetical protein
LYGPAFLAVPGAARAQPSARILVVEARYADGSLERLPELAAELVRLNVDQLIE